jgi:effector-binding domain-containing protein
MNYRCELQELTSQPTLRIRTRTPVQALPDVLGKAYSQIAAVMGEKGAQPAGPPYTAYFNMDMQDLDIEIGFPVDRKVSGSAEINGGEIPAGKYAMCIHTGPYGEIKQAYAALGEWMQEKGCEPSGVAYEQYLNDPSHTPPDQLQTRIMFLLQR